MSPDAGCGLTAGDPPVVEIRPPPETDRTPGSADPNEARPYQGLEHVFY